MAETTPTTEPAPATAPPRAPKRQRAPKVAKPSPDAAKARASAPPAAPPAPASKPTPPSTSGKPSGPTIVDASDLVLGRAASLIAKRLLSGESIVVVNAEKSVVTGSRQSVLEIYRANRARGSVRSGPHFPRYPDRIFRRTVRGMLPHLKPRGRDAFDRLEVHIGVPPEYSAGARHSLDGAKLRPMLRRPLTLGEISILLGARL